MNKCKHEIEVDKFGDRTCKHCWLRESTIGSPTKCHTEGKDAIMYTEDCPHVNGKKFSKQEILDLLPEEQISNDPDDIWHATGWNAYREALIDKINKL